MEFCRKNKITASLLLFFFIASIFFLAGCSKKKQEEIKKESAVPVKVMETKRDRIEDVGIYTGQIDAEDEVKVVSKLSGRVKEVNFEVGDYVKKGDALVILETDELYDQLSQAEATLALARANLAANESGTLPQQLEQAKSAFEQAEDNYLNTKADYERMKALYEANAISRQSFDGMELKYRVAKSQYESAKEQLRLTQERLPKNIEALRAQVAQAQAQVELIKTSIENSVVRAPVSGKISSKQINPGEMCQAGMPLGTIVNIDRVKAVIEVPEEDINRLNIGREATVSVDALGNKGAIKGKISVISPASGANGLFRVEIEIENKDYGLKPGMFAKVNVVRGVKENVITVPKDAVLIKKNGYTVYVVKQGKAEERLVRIGITNGDRVEITEGLKEGETVVTSGQNMLTEGSAVKIL
ncbi:efflux RND transporter periplasmic adaptor subunit [Thermoanaerobacterium sp. DL9XJH110]|uniref:efflux RND transporter periplasmic adaptor subunit n=1 Tax=Thermoanaerobacterium sp. DL9XJH110 TaxID=3386643 RepID=UPI003BB6FEAA